MIIPTHLTNLTTRYIATAGLAIPPVRNLQSSIYVCRGSWTMDTNSSDK